MKHTITGAFTALALIASTLSAVATEQPGVRRTVFVTNKVEKFGTFEQRRSLVFAPGENVRLYVEPTGLVHNYQDGTSRIDVSGGIKVSAADGKIVLQKDDLLTLRRSSQQKMEEPFFNFWANVSKPGIYVVSFRLIDNLSGGSVDQSLPFIVAPEDTPLRADQL